MKKILLSFLALTLSFKGFCDEGMWLPMLVGKNIDSMQAEGCLLSAEDIYNVNHASLKDAVVIFGGGCTGEMISDNGLLITNHHCGYGSIASVSTVEHNYLEKGFWAKKQSTEIPIKGLSVKFLVRMQDVTDVIAKAGNQRNEKKSQRAIDKAIEKIETEASEGGKYLTMVRPFFAGNQHILLVYQVFTDVRLVGTPPKSLGKFGGNTDNWMWPRHTCDFSVFRVYADSNNLPAAYSATNVPYRPKKHLTISLKDKHPEDFAMIMGFPGRTNRYETSYGVDMALAVTNPSIVQIRDLRLAIMRRYMSQDEAVNLKLATEYAQIANYWKYYIGQSEQLKRLHVIADKQKQEQAFNKWSKANQPALSGIMNDFAKVYAEYRPYDKQYVYYREAFGASKLARMAASANTLFKTLSDKHPKQSDIDAGIKKLQQSREQYMEAFVPTVDKEIFARMTELYYQEVPKSQQPPVYQDVIFRQFKSDSLRACFENYSNYTYSHTFLLDNEKFAAFCANPTLEALQDDPAINYALSFVNNYQDNFAEKVVAFYDQKDKLAKKYMAGLMQMQPDKLYYPDANSTMRITYGQVGGYSPQDGIHYDYQTNISGLLAKYVPGDSEFDLPADFLTLAQKADFGPYANADGGLTTCFITNNDITGGNSGSPVMNASGELIGLAFDGNWEAMSGDIAFDKQYKRTIAVDIRFVLWVMDYYGGAKNLISEMTIDK